MHIGNYDDQIRLTLNKLQRKLRFGNALLRAGRFCLWGNNRNGFRLRQDCGAHTGQSNACLPAVCRVLSEGAVHGGQAQRE
jgi:hypothetical protein